MRILIIFLAVFAFGDISDAILKIKTIENLKKRFLKIDYNIFSTTKKRYFVVKSNIELKLYAIFNNRVNINGKWYKIGDIIQGYKIIKITYDKVFLKKGNKIFVLEVKNSILRVEK